MEVDIGAGLGQWEASEYDDGLFWQSGIYILHNGTEWTKMRCRGIPPEAYNPDALLYSLANNEPLRVKSTNFIPYGLADNGRMHQLNTWIEEENVYVMGGTGKRQHISDKWGHWCKHNCGQMHLLTMGYLAFQEFYPNVPHYLPWLDGANAEKEAIGDHVAWTETLAAEDKWMEEW
jgi:hypothetical protein